MFEERRAYKRYKAAYCIETGEKGRGEYFLLWDISKGGACLRDIECLGEGHELDLRIFLRRREFDVRATVVYVKAAEKGENAVGTKFIDYPGEFPGVLEREIEDIEVKQKRLDPNRSQESFRKASIEYQIRRIFLKPRFGEKNSNSCGNLSLP